MSGDNFYQEAEDPKTPAARLQALLNSKDKRLFRKIVRHPNTPSEVMRALSWSPWTCVRSLAAKQSGEVNPG